ncbi:MAG: phosphatidylglycerol lysyltransferase domain-containing protein [bacterium]|nr:phosphatidylglycerol lysyltransferase domain-containing protein [bacterium]
MHADGLAGTAVSGAFLDRFREVRLADRDALAPALAAAGKPSCDYTFTNLYIWGGIYDLRWRRDGDRILVYSGRDDVLYMPLGPTPSPAELAAYSDVLVAEGRSGGYVLVEAAYVEGTPALADSFAADEDPANADYVYSSKALVELKGRRLHRKKNLLSQFRRNNPGYRCAPMERSRAAECFALAEKWCEERICEEIGFEHETSALKRAFDAFEALDLRGIVLETGGRLAGFSIFGELNRDTAVVHFEKYDPALKGSSQAVNWETARLLADRYAYIDREQDLGIERLRRAKLSYCPAFTVRTYRLRRRAGEGSGA